MESGADGKWYGWKVAWMESGADGKWRGWEGSSDGKCRFSIGWEMSRWEIAVTLVYISKVCLHFKSLFTFKKTVYI